MVDYSKWDNLDVSDSEDDAPSGPSVTRFDTASRVTVPAAPHGAGKGYKPVLEVREQPTAPSVAAPTCGSGAGSGGGTTGATTLPPAAAAAAVPPTSRPAADRAGAGVDAMATWTANGYATDTHYFSQSKSDVTLRVLVPPATRAKNIRVSLAADNSLTVAVVPPTGGPPESVLHGVLHGGVRHAVTPAARPELGATGASADKDDDDIDWEVLDCPDPARGGQRMVRVAFRKRPAVAGAVQWWERALQSDTDTVPVGAVKGRSGTPGATLAQVWEDAHRMFRERVAAREAAGLQLMHVGDDDGGDGGDDGDGGTAAVGK